MRKVVLYTLSSLNGAVEDPARYFPEFDPVLSELEARLTGNQDAVLLGRNMFDAWSDYWPTADQPLAQSLLAAGLVDELHLAIGPVLDRAGRRLFENLDDSDLEHPHPLELLSATTSPRGGAWLVYRIP